MTGLRNIPSLLISDIEENILSMKGGETVIQDRYFELPIKKRFKFETKKKQFKALLFCFEEHHTSKCIFCLINQRF